MQTQSSASRVSSTKKGGSPFRRQNIPAVQTQEQAVGQSSQGSFAIKGMGKFMAQVEDKKPQQVIVQADPALQDAVKK
jgi:hypothetical protein